MGLSRVSCQGDARSRAPSRQTWGKRMGGPRRAGLVRLHDVYVRRIQTYATSADNGTTSSSAGLNFWSFDTIGECRKFQRQFFTGRRASGDLAFGLPFGMLKSGKDTARVAKSPAEGFRAIEKISAGEDGLSMETEDIRWIETLNTRAESAGPLGFLSTRWRRIVQRLPYYNRYPESGKKMGALAIMAVARRMANPSARADMLQKLFDARDDDGKPLSPVELAAEAMVLIVAGSDTIAK